MAVVFHPTEGERLPTREELQKENEELSKQVLDAQPWSSWLALHENDSPNKAIKAINLMNVSIFLRMALLNAILMFFNRKEMAHDGYVICKQIFDSGRLQDNQ